MQITAVFFCAILLGFAAAVPARVQDNLLIMEDTVAKHDFEPEDIISCLMVAVADITSCFKNDHVPEHLTNRASTEELADFNMGCVVQALFNFLKCIANKKKIEHNRLL